MEALYRKQCRPVLDGFHRAHKLIYRKLALHFLSISRLPIDLTEPERQGIMSRGGTASEANKI
jgi:hypothetical protein